MRLRGRITVQPGSSSPVVSSLVGQRLPQLTGDVVTDLKPTATAALLADGGREDLDPVLAQWQYGLGRVLVWTPGIRAGWSGTWLGDESQLFDDGLRWVERGVPVPALEPTLTTQDPPGLQVDPLANRGRPLELARLQGTWQGRALRFEEVAPSLYQAALPGAQPGAQQVSVRAGGAAVAALVAVPYPAEFRPRPAGESVLGQLAVVTGGRLLNPSEPGSLRSHQPLALWWVLVVISTALFLAEVALRLTISSRFPAWPTER